MERDASPGGPPDDALVAEYLRDPAGRSGRDAITALIDRWSGHIYRWAYRVVRDRDRALDLSQDSLVRMIEGLPRYEPRGRFSAWLFVIVHHRCLGEVRRRPLNVDAEIDPDALWSGGSSPAELHETDEERGRIFAAMESALEPRERAAIWMRAYEGLSIEDITRALEVGGSTGARGLLQTARRKLRAALREEQP